VGGETEEAAAVDVEETTTVFDAVFVDKKGTNLNWNVMADCSWRYRPV
jgi:hypothetical protein